MIGSVSMMSSTSSAIYDVQVRHRRLSGIHHDFSQKMSLLYLNVDELPALFSRSRFFRPQRWAAHGYVRDAYFPGTDSLRATITQHINHQLGFTVRGPITLLTQASHFGFLFNPVSFAYCFDEQHNLSAVCAEITNTPWGERHYYAVDCRVKKSARFAKQFHISPFQPFAQDYHWQFSAPQRDIHVHMTNRTAGKPVFHAELHGRRTAWSESALAERCVRRPLQSLQTIARIYYEAGKLWWKKAPFYSHPKHHSAHPASA
jgi:uncharacterized protein